MVCWFGGRSAFITSTRRPVDRWLSIVLNQLVQELDAELTNLKLSIATGQLDVTLATNMNKSMYYNAGPKIYKEAALDRGKKTRQNQ